MTNEYREQGGVATPGQLNEFLEHFCAGKVSNAALEAFNRQFREPTKPLTDETYPGILAAAIKACGCDYNSSELTPEVFGPDIFGTLGEGYVLGEPPKSEAAKKRGYWLQEDFDSWLASLEVAGKGLEAACLADLCEYGRDHPKVQLETPVLCWRPNRNGRVACLGRSGSKRDFFVGRREGDWNFFCRVLLRKVRQ